LEYKVLGRSGVVVSKLCFGTLTISPLQRNVGVEKGAALLKSAYEMGVTFFDTAELYGTYPHLRRAFAGVDDVVISTKSYSYDEATAKRSLDKARQGLERDVIDIFMLHEQESVHTLRGHAKAIDYFLKKKQEGVIRAFGVSTHFAACVMAAATHDVIDIVHPIVNMRGLGVADGTREDMDNALRACYDAGKGVFAMKPLGGGHMCADARMALGYAVDHPHVHAVAVGMQSIEEIEDNCAFFSGGRDTALRAAAVKRQLMIHDWCTGCGTCTRVCKGGALSLEYGKIKIDQDRCVFCGYCGAACPQFAIKVI
jgi:aryl-alcohol dehydrogenase-like predicted oxidoreductase/NAD-dependent dihydropyrimidine dehydrogenase PreA subunit